MPDNTEIERTIFKLELDGSAYIEGADKLTASTQKLSQAQEAANKKLKELEVQQASYKKQLDDTTTILKENEKETIDLTKRLNDLKNAGKGASAEAKNLQAQLRGLATNTKEFKSEAAGLKKNLTDTTTAIKVQSKELAAAEKSSGKFSAGMSKVYSSLSKVANIIPGLGIGGLVALIAGPLVDAVINWVASMNDANDALKLITLNQQNVNEVMEAANKAAGKQITDLKILYQTATDANIPLKERLAAVKALQQEFPEYFKNIEAETILNGGAKDSYDALTKSILATARATAAKSKLDELAAQKLAADFQEQKIIIATNNEIAAAKKKNTNIAVATDEFGNAVAVKTPEEQIEEIRNRRRAAIAQEEQNKKLISQQEDFLIKFAGLANIASVTDAEKKAAAEAAKKAEEAKRKAAEAAAKKGNVKTKNPVTQQADEAKEETERLKRILAYNLEVFRNWQKNVEADSKARSQKEKDEMAAMQEEYQKSLDAEQKAFRDFIVAKNKEWDKDPEKKKRIDEVLEYANAVKNVANSVISFWQEANEAEAKALDRSISLQEKRVEAAIRIAERGNAEYLRAEEDRLTELNIQRENAARKQLGIDAALQASQLLVAITGAVAKIANPVPGAGIAETIASIAVIIGALATGYGLVKSLQGNQPSLFVGTKDTGPGGGVDGKGGFNATLHPHEAVIPEETNKKYHPAVSAIYDHSIPAEDLNRFVTDYHKIKPIPQPNYERIKDAAEMRVSHDGKLTIMISEQNDLMRESADLQKQTLRALKSIGVNVNMDKNGFAMSFLEVANQIKIDKKV